MTNDHARLLKQTEIKTELLDNFSHIAKVLDLSFRKKIIGPQSDVYVEK